ncbi:hypothetical protein LTR37_020745 [Vermiconidia calcicola]|uniref:Uncharacterized protein n=1 Tax=Vermiconidia calcicola TaxID=1690605 RepID=A0ACC3MBK8_9PEZI|nr:hypothetical protein LTR37_020745 [Vermiconidia calcicola]
MAATKRKRCSVDVPKTNGDMPPPVKRRTSTRNSSTAAVVNPDVSSEVIDAPDALRASPDSDVNAEIAPGAVKQESSSKGESPLSDAPDVVERPKKKGRGKKSNAEQPKKDLENVIDSVVNAKVAKDSGGKKGKGKSKVKAENQDSESKVKAENQDSQPTASPPVLAAIKAKKTAEQEPADPEADDIGEADEEEVKEASSRPPPVNSDYLPLPWKGRLGFACLNTYLRNSNPPVFSSRTCRIQSILERRHPPQDPNQPEHPTKNRPDRTKPADVEMGKRYVESLCLANIKDIMKMVRWNDRYNIKFFRLSSEMFPFASHSEYGYKLAPFASEALAEAGKVIAELGHRVTTHPGQFTQLGSPRPSVIENAIRDLDYHDEMLSLLKLPEQLDKDAVMILHMGGMFEGKEETLQRFRENYAGLSQSVKNRLVLENDDVIWTVHDLLPVCEELNIPFVLDYHHHNILFDSSQIREGTKDIMGLYPRIKATWDRKGITQKMHYSEPTPPAITGRQRRKHNPRPATLPPCPPDMDLMIEAKDKEQAVFELMKTFKLPGFDTFNDVIPYVRNDDNKIAQMAINKKARKSKKAKEEEEPEPDLVPDDDVGMGGPEGRVYWPPGMEEWLRPKKREVKKKEPAEKSAAQVKKEAAEAYAAREAEKAKAKGGADSLKVEEDEESDEMATPATKKAKAAMRKKQRAADAKAADAKAADAKVADAKAAVDSIANAAAGSTKVNGKKARAKPKKEAPMPSPPSEESEELSLADEDEEEPVAPAAKRPSTVTRKASGRKTKKSVNYNEDDDAQMEEA